MICPLSQQRSWKVRLGFGIQPNVYELRDGADDEGARSAVARHGEEDHLVASSGDHRSERTHDAALAGAVGTGRLRRAGGSPQRGGEPERVSLEVCEKVLGLYRERYYDLNMR